MQSFFCLQNPHLKLVISQQRKLSILFGKGLICMINTTYIFHLILMHFVFFELIVTYDLLQLYDAAPGLVLYLDYNTLFYIEININREINSQNM